MRRRKKRTDSARSSSAAVARELSRLRGSVRTLSRKHRTVVKELLATNEKAQKVNEALQRTNTILDQSRAESEANYAELSAVNDELNDRNNDLVVLNDQLNSLIRNVRMAVVIVGGDGHILRSSPMAERLLNVLPSDVGRPFSAVRTAIRARGVEALLAGVIKTGTAVEREVAAADGRWYLLAIRPSFTRRNVLDGAVLTLTDVDAIRKARELAESIVATAREPILVLDEELRVRRANRAFYQCFGVALGETEGRLVYELGNRQWDIPALRRLLEEVLLDATLVEDFVVEHDFEHIGRKAMQLNARRLHVPGESHESILLAIEDVTERRRAGQEQTRLEDELRRRAEALEDANRAKSDFIAVLSHELRTPLSAISGWAEILKRPDVSDEDRREGVNVIARSSRMQARLISDLLDLQRIESGKLALEIRSVDLRDPIEAAVGAARPAAREKGMQVVFEADTSDTTRVRADAARIQQVLGNLLSNAIKFTPEGATIRVSLVVRDGRVEASVRDSGQGIDAESLPRIFERFRQFDFTAARAQNSLGLGLAVSRQLVEHHGGTIRAESPGRGKGATFTISLPADRGERPMTTTTTTTLSPHSLRGILVLVVDDDPDAREPVRRVLEQHGAEVIAVKSADEALDVLQRGGADVIVSDIQMPGRDGYQLIRAIRALPIERGGRIPAVALTAYGTSEDRDRARQAGFGAHLVKPVEPVDLVVTVSGMLPPPAPKNRRATKS